MRTRVGASAVRLVVGTLALVLVLSGCTATAQPPVQDTTKKTTTTAPARSPRAVTVAVAELGTGFNPHLVADLSPIVTAIADLVLPSVFRPGADGAPVLDPSVAVSASVSSIAPFTVTYVLRDAAQWSDGAPIAAEDFRYLWAQMRTQPGVVDAAGYQLIDEVSSSSGGKTVTVRFAAPYPAWRTLFSGLLPNHLLKDAPGGFTAALDGSIPFSGSRYSVASVDTDRGEVQLQRNDRFWDAPASLDSILLRQVGGAAEVAEALRTDDIQLALSTTDAATTAQLRAVPGLRNTVVPLPSVMQVTVRTTAPQLTSASVRRGVLGLLDPDVLTTIGTGIAPRSGGAGTDGAVLRDQAQLLAPSQPGYTPTAPAPLDAAQARTLIEAGGYTYSGVRYASDDRPLTLVVGADERDPVAVSIAQATADELTAGGIVATARATPATTLYASGAKQADLIVGRAAVGGDLATMMASRFSCPPATTGSAVTSKAPPTTTTTPPPTTTRPTSSETTTVAPTPPTAAPSGANVSGLCDPSLQAPLRAALTGTRDADKVAAELEPLLWAQGVVLPLYQDTRLLSVGPTLQGVSSDVTLTQGPLVNAARWTRSPS